ncbi:MAG TPA: DUF998 domain-containing protein [Propionibacteriaceae bacterium]|nr:DUF998 domain-containing protein [Propionibacteriaceae bacterium]
MATTLAGRPATAAAKSRRSWTLAAGIVAGPLFVTVSLAQIPFREGFDMTRHAFSFLLIGPGGWLQTTNFALVGLLFVVAGVGLRRSLTGRVGRAAQVLATTLGAGLLLAAAFPPPPAFGYPIGAPPGVPAAMTTNALLHAVGFITGVLSFTILQFVLASWLWAHRQRGWAAVAMVTGLALLTVPPTSGLPFGTIWLYLVVSAAYLLTAIHFARLRRG